MPEMGLRRAVPHAVIPFRASLRDFKETLTNLPITLTLMCKGVIVFTRIIIIQIVITLTADHA